ncbi:MAG: hypothetical protein PVJ34_11165, partial [Anaerolineae bacterium]
MFTRILVKLRSIVVLVCLLAGAIVPPAFAVEPVPAGAAWLPLSIDPAVWPGDAGGFDVGFASAVQDAAILGGERDAWLQQAADGTSILRLEWDGEDGDYASLDHTGLGGVDLARSGFQDHFVLEVVANALPVEVTIEVWTNADRVSRYSLMVPGGIGQAAPFFIPFADFVASTGSGADWADVGAIVLLAHGEDLSGLVLGGLAVRSFLTVSRAESLPAGAGGGGGVVAHTVIITNESGRPSADLTFEQPVFERRARLVPGSVSSNRGQVLDGGHAVRVAVGVLDDGESATVTYETVRAPRAIVPADLVLQDGDTPPGGGGGPVTTLNHPYTNGDGQVGFT